MEKVVAAEAGRVENLLRQIIAATIDFYIIIKKII